ncbi:hypothetical protein AB3464_15030 [Pseudomonas asplenii]|uniref:hypothetical protein n=1 Tax=Pseudomonas asplenii TaxID=53407 RepID=UPI0037CBA8D5
MGTEGPLKDAAEHTDFLSETSRVFAENFIFVDSLPIANSHFANLIRNPAQTYEKAPHRLRKTSYGQRIFRQPLVPACSAKLRTTAPPTKPTEAKACRSRSG